MKSLERKIIPSMSLFGCKALLVIIVRLFFSLWLVHVRDEGPSKAGDFHRFICCLLSLPGSHLGF